MLSNEGLALPEDVRTTRGGVGVLCTETGDLRGGLTGFVGFRTGFVGFRTGFTGLRTTFTGLAVFSGHTNSAPARDSCKCIIILLF